MDTALDAAISVFREHGFAGTSASMLSDAMKIGRQSLYDTFGDKWRLYCSAVSRYSADEVHAHLKALKTGTRAIDGLRLMMLRVAAEAKLPCLGIGSITEFGLQHDELNGSRLANGAALQKAIVANIKAAQRDGDISEDVDPRQAAGFLVGNIGGIRIAARSGAPEGDLKAMAEMALKALR